MNSQERERKNLEWIEEAEKKRNQFTFKEAQNRSKENTKRLYSFPKGSKIERDSI
jgi:hypothetical protein